MIEENQIKILPKKIPTKKEGIFYKEIQQFSIDEKGKVKASVIDKVYVVRYRDGENKERLYTVGKYSEGVREAYCKTKRDEFILMAKNGELPTRLKNRLKKKSLTLDEVFQMYKKLKQSESKDIIKTEQKYKSNIFKVFGHTDINEITTDAIVAFRQSLLDKNLAGMSTAELNSAVFS